MARIPEAEIKRLKNEVSIERLVEASGVELKKAGKDWLGKCPFHADVTASLGQIIGGQTGMALSYS